MPLSRGHIARVQRAELSNGPPEHSLHWDTHGTKQRM